MILFLPVFEQSFVREPCHCFRNESCPSLLSFCDDLEIIWHWIVRIRLKVKAMTQRSNIFPRCIKNRRGQRFRLINAGIFSMGESFKTRDVVLTKPFYMAETPVTRAQWHAVMGTTPWDVDDPDPGNWDHPATHVSYFDVLEYCRLETIAGTRRYRLPTETEWEYACRAGTETDFCFGDSDRLLCDYGWFLGNSDGQTQPVRQKKPNPWGLYDTHGLVAEWCNDDWQWQASVDLIDPVVRNNDNRNVVRGGSWASHSEMCESYMRYGVHADWRLPHVGFRLALDTQPRNKKKRPAIHNGAKQCRGDILSSATT